MTTVAYDATGPAGGAGTNSATTPLAWTHICGASATALVVGVTSLSGTSNLVTGVTYGGVTMTFLKYQVSGTNGGIALYYLDAAGGLLTGTNTVSAAFTGAGDTIGGSVSFTGSGGHGTAVGTTSGAGVGTVTTVVNGTAAGGMIAAAGCQGSGAGTWAATNSGTMQWSLDVSGSTSSDNAGGGTWTSTGGGANQTVGFSAAGVTDNWSLAAVEILPAGVNSGPNYATAQSSSAWVNPANAEALDAAYATWTAP